MNEIRNNNFPSYLNDFNIYSKLNYVNGLENNFLDLKSHVMEKFYFTCS